MTHPGGDGSKFNRWKWVNFEPVLTPLAVRALGHVRQGVHAGHKRQQLAVEGRCAADAGTGDFGQAQIFSGPLAYPESFPASHEMFLCP